jgi:hypothetical protein
MDTEKTYVEKVNDWLNANPTTRSLELGAKLMLQGNRNQILHKNVLFKQNVEKVIYELEKIVGPERQTADQVKAKKTNPDITELEAKAFDINVKLEQTDFKGKHPDHDLLPDDIKLIPEKNTEIYHQMRSLFEKLKVYSGENYSAEKRLPLLTELLEKETVLATNWKTYDLFDVNIPVIVAAATKTLPEGEKIDAKRVSANRKYLSDNKAKITALLESGKDDKAAELLAKMQIRFDELLRNGDTFAPEQLAELKALGLNAE